MRNAPPAFGNCGTGGSLCIPDLNRGNRLLWAEQSGQLDSCGAALITAKGATTIILAGTITQRRQSKWLMNWWDLLMTYNPELWGERSESNERSE